MSKLIALLDVIVIGRDRNMVAGPIHTFSVIAVFLLVAGSTFSLLF